MRGGEGGQKLSVFVQAQGIETVHAGGGEGIKKWQNYVHIVVECPLKEMGRKSKKEIR